jgi:DNA-binding CsgD family transcriptional regulator
MVKPTACDVGAVDFAALIEAAYREDGNDHDWLRRIVTCVQPGLDQGRGVVGCLFIADVDGTASVVTAVGVGALRARPEAVAAAALPALATHADGPRAGTIACATEGAGARECSGIVASDRPSGERVRAGCALLAPVAGAVRLSRDAVTIWRRVAHHLGAALRLRAVPYEQMLWHGLLSGRWALVDHFDAGGRRFIVARAKQPPSARPPVARLTGRERDACLCAAAGWANKVIAAELGVAVSTVASLLQRATRKLRCRSRAELIRACRFVEETWDDNENARDRPPADDLPGRPAAAG